jgi:hypothetical protein
MGSRLVNEVVSSQVELAGHTVVGLEELNHFMARHRIRQYGVLTSQEVQAAHQELGVDYVLLGSIMLRDGTENSAASSIFTLVRAADAQEVWSYANGLSLEDRQTMFNLAGPSSLEELWNLLAFDAFADLPAIMLANLLPDQEDSVAVSQAAKKAKLQIDFASFYPRYVKPGEDVKCSVHFRSLDSDENGAPAVFIKVGSRVHVAHTDNGLEYEVSWIGSEGNPGRPFQLALNDPTLFYQGMWDSENLEAGYPVNIIVEWPSGKREEVYIGSYIVDSTPPDVKLIAGAKEYDSRKTFRHKLPLTVRWGRPEKVDRWKLAVYDQQNKQVIMTKGTAELPPSFVWGGKNSGNKKAKEGLYSVVLQVWDLAGNRAVASEKVYYLPDPPEVELSPVVSPEDESMQLSLSLKRELAVPMKYWRLEVWTKDNDLLSFHEGVNFPENITLPVLTPEEVAADIDAKLTVLDELGGKLVTSFTGLYAKGAALQKTDQAAQDSQITSESGWEEDF